MRQERRFSDRDGANPPSANHVVMMSHNYGERAYDANITEAAPASAAGERPTRYCDHPMDWRTRLFGVSGTALVMLAVMIGALFTWHVVSPAPQASAPIMVELLPLSLPPKPATEVPEGPQQVEQQEQKPKEREERPEPPEIVIPRLSPITVAVEPPVEPVVAAEAVPETTAPRSLPAPAGNRASSNAEATWEALLLAHLEQYRRYPARARAARQQGVAYVRFRMNRAGTVLSAEITRSSGSAILDRAALDTVRRAQPLPAIPDDKPNILELSVPVEFFVRR